ncbi:ATP-binding protein [candidate division KSB1 bacterium]
MKEIVIISGKGGTGKTSLTASFAALARPLVVADCDVDAPDLYLVAEPKTIKHEKFIGGKKAFIRNDLCSACGKCLELCRFEAVRHDGLGNDTTSSTYRIVTEACEGCGVCVHFCPNEAIDFKEQIVGSWYLSNSRFGPMAHAELHPGGENSGRLVTLVRDQAKRLAEGNRLDLILIDGPPGIGCPVIASVTGTDLVVIVTESTVAGLHDLKRAIELSAHFNITTVVIINRFDINAGKVAEIKKHLKRASIPLVGLIPYDPDFSRAQINCLSLVEYANSKTSEAIRKAWGKIISLLDLEQEGVRDRQRDETSPAIKS